MKALSVTLLLCGALVTGCRPSLNELFGLKLNDPLPSNCMVLASWTNKQDGTLVVDVGAPKLEQGWSQCSACVRSNRIVSVSAHPQSVETAAASLLKRFGKPDLKTEGFVGWSNRSSCVLFIAEGTNSVLSCVNADIGSRFFRFVTDPKYALADASSAAFLFNASTMIRADQERAVENRKSCESNLKVIWLTMSTWALDHGQKYPFQVPGRDGGTLELCRTTEQGYDVNAWQHLLAMKNNLLVFEVVCPDEREKGAKNWNSFTATNLSYLLRTGPQITEGDSKEVLAVCPKHKLILRCDGSVEPAYMLSDSERASLGLK
jgi:hypothetical protein